MRKKKQAVVVGGQKKERERVTIYESTGSLIRMKQFPSEHKK
jgi:hypothetical protein